MVAGNNNLSVPVPAGAVTDLNLGARFRVSSAGGLTALGAAPDGEVEDYLVSVQKPGRIGNYVWVDENSDGYQDAGEPGMPNVTVELYDEHGRRSWRTTVTDSDGGYLFSNLPPASYYVDVRTAQTVRQHVPAGMTQTPPTLPPGPGADFGNQDHGTTIPGAGGFTGYPVTIGSGEENLTADFGYNYNPSTDVQRRHGHGRPGRPGLDRCRRRRRAGSGRSGSRRRGRADLHARAPTASSARLTMWPAPRTPPTTTATTCSTICRRAPTWSR